jgi:hypothetical protein
VGLRTGYKAASELGEKEIMNFFNEETCEKNFGAKEEDLEALHRVLFGRIGAAIHRKRNLIHFEGFDFFQESDDFAAVVKKIIEVGPANLVYLCWLFGLEKDGSTEALGRKICIFLCKQVKDTTSASFINGRVAEEIKKKREIIVQHRSGNLQTVVPTDGRTSVCTRSSHADFLRLFFCILVFMSVKCLQFVYIFANLLIEAFFFGKIIKIQVWLPNFYMSLL